MDDLFVQDLDSFSCPNLVPFSVLKASRMCCFCVGVPGVRSECHAYGICDTWNGWSFALWEQLEALNWVHVCLELKELLKAPVEIQTFRSGLVLAPIM